MQVTPIALLIAALFLELISAVVGNITNYEYLLGLHKWTSLISAFLSLFAAVSSVLLLIMKKFSSILNGFSVTLLSALSFTVFVTYAFYWWLLP